MIYGEDRSLFSRNGKSLTRRFKELRIIAERFGDHRAIVDGESVAFVDNVPSSSAATSKCTSPGEVICRGNVG